MNKIAVYILLFISPLFLLNCVKEESDSAVLIEQLYFSTDTVFFDTIFTDIGSTTQYLSIHNRSNQEITINTISLGSASSSLFRINVDGISKKLVNNISLAPKDSLYILVELTINPNDKNSPFVVKDSITLNIDGYQKDVKLMAWGQNAHYIDGRYNGHVKTSTWTADKPYLIYNSMQIDSLQTLTIEKGTQIYLHKNSYIIAKGNLKIKGTYEDPVVIQGDRLEQHYKDIPGQWGNIILADGSGIHDIDWCVIKNGIIGFQLGALSPDAKPVLNIHHSIIKNMNYAGIFSLASTVNADNCLIADCGFYNLALLVGGSYNFTHCTIANYWKYAKRTESAVVISNNFVSNGQQFLGNLANADFVNTIIYGDQDDELLISKVSGTDFNYAFKNCLLKVKNTNTATSEYQNIIINKEPLFILKDKILYSIEKESPAKDKADIDAARIFETDLLNQSHLSDSKPDIGAYELQ